MAATSLENANRKMLLKLRMTQVVALNFPIAPRVLKKYVPKNLELDFFRDDETYVSLVARKISGVRAYGFPLPLTTAFGELNLRFYVRRPTESGYKTGVCTIQNYVSSRLGALVLGRMFDSKIDRMKMKFDNTGFTGKQVPKVDYTWESKNGKPNRLRIQARDRINIVDDSKVGFILNHFNIYATHEGRTLEYSADHPPWTIWDAAQANFTCDVKRLFGEEFGKALKRRPASVFVSVGSGVTVYRPTEVV